MLNFCFIGNRIRARIKIAFYAVLRKLTKRRTIIDITGTILTPGNLGKACKGNGKHLNYRGKYIECCCDECDYLLCCIKPHRANQCLQCTDMYCPHSKK